MATLTRLPGSTLPARTTRSRKALVVRAYQGDAESRVRDATKDAVRDTQDAFNNKSSFAPSNNYGQTGGWSEADADEANAQFRETLDKLKARWDRAQDKKTILVLAAGGLFGTWLVASVLGPINRIPFIPIKDTLVFIGLIYTSNFFWKYLLFQEGRDELYSGLRDWYTNLRDNIEGGQKTDLSVNLDDGKDKKLPSQRDVSSYPIDTEEN